MKMESVRDIAASMNGHGAIKKKGMPWPKDLDPVAYYGLAGEIVKTILPETDSDPAAMLLTFLVAFSSQVGRGPHFKISGVKNHLNLFGIVVGGTNEGRKGTSNGVIGEVFRCHDETWEMNNSTSGLSSGEGLIGQVHDPITRRVPIREQGRSGKIIDYQNEEVDQGITDKRVFVFEGEFSRTLKVMQRDGNTLSEIMRTAWDTGNLRTMVKNNPMKATGASISILGHITPGELKRNFRDTEMANGFANRFLWTVSRKSKFNVEGGHIPGETFKALGAKLKNAVDRARDIDEIRRDEMARQIWKEAAPELDKAKPGLSGEMIARGVPQVMRLACIYAALDGSEIIEAPHLTAALAIWQRNEESVKYLFGQKTGDWMADRILDEIRMRGEIDRTEVIGLFGRNQSATRIGYALESIEDLIITESIKTGESGRPKTLLKLKEEAV